MAASKKRKRAPRGGRNEWGEHEPPELGGNTTPMELVLAMGLPIVVDRLLDRLMPSSARAARGPASVDPLEYRSDDDAVAFRDVRPTKVTEAVYATCKPSAPDGGPAGHALCGERYVPLRWICCPYCGRVLQAVPQ